MKKRRSRRVQITLRADALQQAEALHRTGFWGKSFSKTIEELVCAALRAEREALRLSSAEF